MRYPPPPPPSPDGGYAAAGSADGGVYIWSVTNGNLETCLSGKHRYVAHLNPEPIRGGQSI